MHASDPVHASGPVVFNCFFLWKVVRQNDTNVTSFCMQFKKLGRGLLRWAFQTEGERVVSLKRGGNKKGSVLENSVNTEEKRDKWKRRKPNTQLATLHSFLIIEIASVFTEFSWWEGYKKRGVSKNCSKTFHLSVCSLLTKVITLCEWSTLWVYFFKQIRYHDIQTTIWISAFYSLIFRWWSE